MTASPASLWQATARPAAAHPQLAGALRTDVAIVGGGFTGLSAALHLRRLGVACAVLEAGAIGAGASGRNGGQVNPGLRVGRGALVQRFGEETGEAIHALAQTAPDFVFGLIDELGLQCDAVRGGTFRLAHTGAALDVFKRAGEALAAEGIPVELLDRAAAAARTGTERYQGGYFDPRGGAVQPLDLCRGLAAAAAKEGAAIFTRSPAQRLERAGAGWRVASARGTIEAERVVIATNAYTDGLIPGLMQTVLPVNSFQIATLPLDAAIGRPILPGGATVADSRRLILYFRKDGAGRLVLGGRASFDSGAGDRSSDYRVLRRILTDIYPSTRDAPIESSWTGLVCITPDFLPHLHEPMPGVTALLGYNGRGVALSIRMGAVLAEALARGGPTIFPTTRLHPIPFHRWRQPVLNAIMAWHAAMDRLGR